MSEYDNNEQGRFSGSSNDNSVNSDNNSDRKYDAGAGDTAGNGQKGNYGSSAYSGYNFGNGSSTNSYGSYDYGSSSTGSNAGSTNYGSTGNGTSDSAHKYGNYQYSGYQYQQEETSGNNRKGKKPHKKGGAVKKVLLCIALGLVFGACCGVGIYAVNKYTGTSNSAADQKTEAAQSAEAGTQSADAAASATDKLEVTTTTSDDNLQVVTDVTQVVKDDMPAIVAIDNNYTQSVQSIFGQVAQAEATASGSGIIIGKSDSELLIVTNNHVVENADSLKVQFIDETKADADVKGTDPDLDLAVIAVSLSDLKQETIDQISVATLGDSSTLQVGEPAIAIGNALGYGQSVTTGVISALNREIQTSDGETNKYIQTDAAINPGNSGGALLNSRGEVIGINSNKIGGTAIEGMGYAIPISEAQSTINKLMNEETKVKADESKRGYLGVSVMTPTGVEGAYVSEVYSGTAAEKSGIIAGDIITKVDDTDITSRDDLIDTMKYYEAGTKVSITVLRKGTDGYKEEVVSVKLDDGSIIQSQTQNQSGSGSSDENGMQIPSQGGNSQGDNSQGSGSTYGSSDPFSAFGF